MAVSGADIVNQAEKYLGDRYVFGAEGPNTFDCSGLVQYVYKHFGIKTPRTAHEQQHFGTAITRSQLRPGDLIFFSWGADKVADHVGIYVGNGKMINAPHTGAVVRIQTPSWGNAVAYRRFPGVVGGPATNESAITDAIKIGTGAAVDALKGSSGSLTAQLLAPLVNIASGVAEIGGVAQTIGRAFLPSNLMRAACGVLGTIFLLFGLFFMAREARN